MSPFRFFRPASPQRPQGKPPLAWLTLRVSFVFPLPILLALVSNLPAQQLTADQQAEMVLNSARKAFNEKNFPFAVTRFREFLAKFPNHKDAAAAHYGLALALLELPEADFREAVEHLQPLAANKGFTEYPLVLYHLGLARRGLGTKELALAAAKPHTAVCRYPAGCP